MTTTQKLVDDDDHTNANPPIKSTANLDAHPNPYAHTLQAVTSANDTVDVQFPFVVDWTFQAPLQYPTVNETISRIGQGVYPGAYDSMRLLNLDGDEFPDLVFGNFDGFVHWMEVDLDPAGQPILKDRWRSPPLRWGISSLAVSTTGGQPAVFAATSAGKIYKIPISGGALGNPTEFAQGHPDLGTGYLHHLTIGNFHPAPGNELMVQNELNEFVMFNLSGGFLGKTDRTYDPAAVPPKVDVIPNCGRPVKYNIADPLNVEELFVPCSDGLVRMIQWSAGKLRVTVESPWLPNVSRCSLVFDPDNNPANGFFLVLGVVPNTTSQSLLHVVSIRDANPHLVASLPTSNNETAVALDWYDTAHTNLLVTTNNRVRRIGINADGTFNASAEITPITIPGVPAPDAEVDATLPTTPPELCSLETGAGVAPWNTEHSDYVYVSAPNGRIFILNRTDLSFARRRAPLEDPGGFGNEPWHSNRTFSHCFGVTCYDSTPDDGLNNPLIYVADPHTPYGSLSDKYRRVATIDPANGLIDDVVHMDPFDPAGKLRERDLAIARNSSGVDQYFTALESTAVYNTGTALRQFSMFRGPYEGGFIYWSEGASSGRLENFTIPIDSSHLLDDYPTLEGGNRIKGQVSTFKGAAENFYNGQAAQVALLRRNGTNVPHLIVGTLGGFTYAVDLTASQTADNALSYYSLDEGWHVIGMDVGDLSSPPDPVDNVVNEVVIGTFLDTGTRQDYLQSHVDMNRGALVILKTTTEATTDKVEFDRDRLNIVGLGSNPDLRMTSGFLGVKIDDVNGDGTNELWVGDAAGHLYLLRREVEGGPWQFFFRSRSLGAFAGPYNTIFPIKTGSVTTQLIVFTSGYVYRFNVLYQQLPPIPHGG